MNRQLSALGRRDLLKLGLALAGAPVFARLPRAWAAGEPITLLGIFPSSGAYAEFGRDTNRGFRLAIEQARAGVLDRPLRYISRDSETKPGVAVQRVGDAIEHDGARFFAGCASSAVALALEPIAKEKKSLFFTSVGADEVTGKDCNRFTFRWSVPTYAAVRSTMYPFIERFPAARRWYTITPAYVFGTSLLNNVRQVAREKGIELVGNAVHPLGTTDFSSYITRAIEARPDVVALLNFGGDAIRSVKTAAEYGLKKHSKLLYVWSGGLSDYKAIGAEALEGVYVGCQYWHDATPATRAASKPYQAAYGEPMGYVGGSAWIEFRLIIDGVAKAGSADPARVAQALEGFQYVGPTGPEVIRAFDHQVLKPYYLLLGKKRAAMRDQWDYVDTLSVSSYPVPEKESLCRM